jgi:hypothetical protein
MLGAKTFVVEGSVFCFLFLHSLSVNCATVQWNLWILTYITAILLVMLEFRVYILALQIHVGCEISQSSNAFSHCGSFAHCSTSIGLCIWSGVLVTVVPEFWIGMAPLGCLQSQVLLSCCRPQVSHFWCNMAWKTCFYFVCKFNKLKLVIWWSK